MSETADNPQPKSTVRNTVHLRPPWKPGESGNPHGRKSYGAFVKDHINSLALKIEHNELSFKDLRQIAKNDPNTNRRTAALRLLRAVEQPDLADFEPLLDGKKSLKAARRAGVPTDALKRVKTKRRTIDQGEGKPPIIEVEREIELRDTSLEEFSDIMDRTGGQKAADLNITDGHTNPTEDLAAFRAAVLRRQQAAQTPQPN